MICLLGHQACLGVAKRAWRSKHTVQGATAHDPRGIVASLSGRALVVMNDSLTLTL